MLNDYYNIVSFSGGKDSTATLFMMLDNGINVNEIVFADTGLELPETYEFIEKVKRAVNIKFTVVKPTKSYHDYFFTKFQKGNHKDEIYGFPKLPNAWCSSRLKLYPLRKYLKNIKNKKVWLGITYDEKKRYQALKGYNDSYLYLSRVTSNQARAYCEKIGMLNPIYKKFRRSGCYLCNKKRNSDFVALRKYYPSLYQDILDLQIFSPTKFRPKETFFEMDKRLNFQQLDLFNDTKDKK